MFSRRRHRRVERGRDHHVEERIGRPAPGLPVVIGAFHALDRIGEMQVAAQAGRILRQRREFRHRIQRDVDLAGRAPDLEVLHPAQERIRQFLFLDQFQEGALHIGVGDDEPAMNLLAAGQHHAHRPASLDQYALDLGAGADGAAGSLEGSGERLGDGPHAAARIAPGADRAVDLAHVMVQQHVGRAGRHRPQRRADDAGDGEIGLDDVGLEILVEEIRDRHRPEAQRQRHLFPAQPGEFLAEIKHLAEVARPEACRVGRGAHQKRLDEAALPRHIAGIAVVGLRVALREPRELAAVCVVVAAVGEIVAVMGEHRPALVGDDLQAEARQLQVAHDLGPEQRADIGAIGIEEAPRQLAAGGCASDPVVLFHHQYVEPGTLQVAGVDQPVVAAADDDRVPALHRGAFIVAAFMSIWPAFRATACR